MSLHGKNHVIIFGRVVMYDLAEVVDWFKLVSNERANGEKFYNIEYYAQNNKLTYLLCPNDFEAFRIADELINQGYKCIEVFKKNGSLI